MLRLTLNDHPDVDFIPLIVQYVVMFGLIYLVKSLVVRHAKTVKKLIDVVVYDTVLDLFRFAGTLFIVIIVRLVQDYFEFGEEDIYSVTVLFTAFSFFTRLGARYVTNARID